MIYRHCQILLSDQVKEVENKHAWGEQRCIQSIGGEMLENFVPDFKRIGKVQVYIILFRVINNKN